MAHKIGWEDGGMVNVLCGGDGDKEFQLDRDGRPEESCPYCGVLVRLHWDVRIIEVPTAEPKP